MGWIGTAWTAIVGDAILAGAFVIYASTPAPVVDPHVAHIEWADGQEEDIYAVNKDRCHEILEDINVGAICYLAGKQCGWQPVGREGIQATSFSCTRTSHIPGGS